MIIKMVHIINKEPYPSVSSYILTLFTSGHGPGVTVILSGTKDNIKPVIKEDANIANYLKYQNNTEDM